MTKGLLFNTTMTKKKTLTQSRPLIRSCKVASTEINWSRHSQLNVRFFDQVSYWSLKMHFTSRSQSKAQENTSEHRKPIFLEIGKKKKVAWCRFTNRKQEHCVISTFNRSYLDPRDSLITIRTRQETKLQPAVIIVISGFDTWTRQTRHFPV